MYGGAAVPEVGEQVQSCHLTTSSARRTNHWPVLQIERLNMKLISDASPGRWWWHAGAGCVEAGGRGREGAGRDAPDRPGP